MRNNFIEFYCKFNLTVNYLLNCLFYSSALIISTTIIVILFIVKYMFNTYFCFKKYYGHFVHIYINF